MPRGQSCDHRQNFHIPDNIASFPGPTQLFVTCSTEKQGEPGIFSHEHDIMNGENFFRTNSCALCIVQPTTRSTLGVYDNCPLICVVSYLLRWLFLLFWALCTHAQLNPFYHPFYPDVTHVRKDTGPPPPFSY